MSTKSRPTFRYCGCAPRTRVSGMSSASCLSRRTEIRCDGACMTTDISVNDPLASLEELDLTHPLMSRGGWAQSMDPKHNLKRWRTRLYSEKGVQIATGRLSLNKHTLLRLFRMWDPKTDFSQQFNAADK